MSTFFLLPPRPLVAQCFADFLDRWLPGVDRSRGCGHDLNDVLGTLLGPYPDVFIVYREELPDGEELTESLVRHFGAEAGDEVVEVRLASRAGDTFVQRWQIEHHPNAA